MVIFRVLKAILTSRWLWTFIGLALIGGLIWFFGALVSFGSVAPLADPAARLGAIAVLFILWLVWMILAQRRAIRANRLFVAELAAPEPLAPEDEAVAAVGARFQQVLDELRRRKAGGRGLLREMPWYVIIGPPAGGKTTALRQSGLEFPFDPGDDLGGVGGTRNCDWFFTEQAVLIDTAGRYALQESQPKVDAAEWLGFLDLLRKHRGRRALNGVLVAIPTDLLAGGEASIRAHGREIRKRLAEIRDRLETRLPVYLVLTKADLIAGFEPSFADLGTAEREQVWGATFAPGERADAGALSRELALLIRRLEERVGPRMEGTEDLRGRAEVFRFPAQIAALEPALRVLVETTFGESRYEESAWLRGFYLTSATQEGTPIDRLVATLSSSFGLPAAAPAHGSFRVERRSFFLRRLMSDVIFAEAGLATLDPKAEARRTWAWRGGAVAAAAALLLGALGLTFSYLSNRGAVVAQADAFERLRAPLAAAAAQQVPRDLSAADLSVGLDAVAEVDAARAPLPGTFARLVGPSAAPEVEAAQETAYADTLRDMLEPRMVALLESTMWRQIRDPNVTLDALKTYRMMTGGTAIDPDFVSTWWTQSLPPIAAVPPFPDDAARVAELEAIARMPEDRDFIAPDDALVTAALRSICSIPLAKRAYAALLSDPAATALRDWVPAAYAGPNGARVFARHSGKSLRLGVRGIYTYEGYHTVVLPRLDDVAAQAAHDAAVFTGGCVESAEASPETLAQDMLKLYYDDYIAQWDGLLHDLTLAPLTDLSTASENLKDLASADSALRRLLTAVVAETDLARPPDPAAEPAAPTGVSKYLGKLGKLGKAAKTAAKYAPAPSGTPRDTSGQAVSDRFRPLKGTIAEVDGAPPSLDTAAAALTALSNTLQTVAASPDPDQAIKEQGGLAQLTGAVTNEAALLPDPVDAWLNGIAGDTTSLTREAVVSQINAAWAADVLDWCRTVASRYPLDPSNPSDISVGDFARVFGPGQLIDSFIDTQIKPFVDMTARPWKWRGDLGLDAGALAALEQARRIRDALFPAGAGPTMAFTLEPKDLAPSAARVTLDLDGQRLSYFNSAARPQQMTWPGTDGTGVITLAFQPVDGPPDVMQTERGPWAWLRMLRGALTPGTLPEVFRLRLATQGQWADFELRAASVDNPFDLKMFSSFTCPARF
ncbi:type VI secretion system membrane subunit TssM [Amaricoccus solimangrovi]|uniref:Type VI secretion system membrane subunit TssM n=1 Tax=Amaricoccus solimangrovi TaxID=2589815 RepID=A0A501WLS7_9RHOB|nr:type VI secretion system membrane subunit TssM [Amaricoccus solimangrovi]TPE49104.1 type VI secretion system membrane subunit TssM [Amaricoccus solimangrovi]